jgi:hypothetical protein
MVITTDNLLLGTSLLQSQEITLSEESLSIPLPYTCQLPMEQLASQQPTPSSTPTQIRV